MNEKKLALDNLTSRECNLPFTTFYFVAEFTQKHFDGLDIGLFQHHKVKVLKILWNITWVGGIRKKCESNAYKRINKFSILRTIFFWCFRSTNHLESTQHSCHLSWKFCRRSVCVCAWLNLFVIQLWAAQRTAIVLKLSLWRCCYSHCFGNSSLFDINRRG